MKVAFVQALPVMLESYLVLSACLEERGIESEVFIECFEKDLISKIVESKAELVGFNCLTGSYNWAFNIAKQIKLKKDVSIVLGGCHPTYYPEMVDFDTFDYICVGEGEYALVELAEAITNKCYGGNIKNIGIKDNGAIRINQLRPLINDLAILPFANRGLYHKYGYFLNQDMYKYRTSRYCPYRCTFCFMPNFAELYRGQKIFREYPVSYIVAELEHIKKDYKRLKTIFFSDDIFGVDIEWADELLRMYKEKINIPYVITTRIDLIDDDFIKLLKHTGCRLVSISIETSNERLRGDVLNKHIPNRLAIEVGRKLHDAGIKTRVDCIFCLPGETLKDAFGNVRFMKEMRATDPVGFLLQPFPKTGIHDYAVKSGYLKNKVTVDDLDPLIYFKTPIEIPDKENIIKVQRLSVLACKIPYFEKLLKVLVKLPNNALFEIIHKIGIAISHKQFYGLSWSGLIRYLLSANRLNKKRKSGISA